jgi:hypothetical protein
MGPVYGILHFEMEAMVSSIWDPFPLRLKLPCATFNS